MSLEEKFKEIIFNYDYVPNTMTQSAKQCVQICDEFAVGFAEWVLDRFTFKDFIYKEPKELLEIYKQGL